MNVYMIFLQLRYHCELDVTSKNISNIAFVYSFLEFEIAVEPKGRMISLLRWITFALVKSACIAKIP